MGACTSKTKKNKEKHLKNDVTNGGNNNHNQKNSIAEQIQDRHSSSANADQFANVPFIDSEDKVTATNPAVTAPKATPETPIPTETVDNDDEKTTVKTNFETNVTYSSAETIDKLKKEVYGFLKEKILPIKEEKEKLFDYIHKRCQTNPPDSSPSTNIDDCLEECFHEIEQGQHPDQENGKPLKKRLMSIITIYVASQSADNSFLKALYDKLGPSLDLNSLNAETSEHEVVNITVTKTVRQVFLDGSSTVLPPTHSTTTNQNGTTNDIHIENNGCNIPADLPDDIRLKAEQVLNSFNDALHNKQN